MRQKKKRHGVSACGQYRSFCSDEAERLMAAHPHMAHFPTNLFIVHPPIFVQAACRDWSCVKLVRRFVVAK